MYYNNTFQVAVNKQQIKSIIEGSWLISVARTWPGWRYYCGIERGVAVSDEGETVHFASVDLVPMRRNFILFLYLCPKWLRI